MPKRTTTFIRHIWLSLRLTGKLSTFYALPVYDYSEKQIGVVVAVIDSLKLCSTVSDVVIGKQSHPYVINRTTLDEILLFYVKRNSGKEWR